MQDPTIPQLPPSAPWWASILALVVGGAGMRFAQVWLENRRADKKEFQGVLQLHVEDQAKRISDLEGKLASAQDARIDDLISENTELRTKIAALEKHVAELEAKLLASAQALAAPKPPA